MVRSIVRMLLFTALLVLWPLSFSIGQDTWVEPSFEDASKLMQEQKFREAADILDAITREDPSDGPGWLQLGLCYHNLQDYKKALSAYKKADYLQYQLPTTRYNIACAYSLLDDRDAAFDWLGKAIEAGFASVQMLETDRDLVNLRKDDRFKAAVLAADQVARPCEYVDEYSQLDFWTGEWDVYTPQGQLAGHSLVEKILNGCTVFEQWSSQFGYDGKSINYYDPSAKKWYQVWISGSGAIIRYEGEFTGGAMRLSGQSIASDGAVELSRMTLTPLEEGKVRQHIERSTDNGATWSLFFDGTYVPFRPAPTTPENR